MEITQEERNAIKSKIQDEIAELSVTNPFLIIEMGTGSGKGLALLKCIDKCTSDKRWIIFVPEIAQIANMEGEIEKFGYSHLLYTKIDSIECYASMKKYENQIVNIALNEVQNLSDARFDSLSTIDYDKIIADSATIPYEIRYKLEQLGDFYTYSLPLKEGIELGILPKPKIYTVPVLMSSIKEKFEYTKYKKKVTGSAQEYYVHLSDQMDYWRKRYNRENDKYMENKSLQYASMRKRFLGSLKTIKAKELIDKFVKTGKRFIVFSSDIKQAEQLGGSKLAIHSKKSAKVNKEVLRKFNALETDKIFPVGMLISGMTLSKLQVGLVVQLDSGANNENLKIIQTCGRVLRDEEPELYILYIPGTKDEDYLQNAIKALGEEYIIKTK